MLLDNQKILIKWSARNKNWYISKGYNFTKNGDVFEVNPVDLSKGSHKKVKVKCDYCGKVVEVEWRDFLKHLNKKYACGKCRQRKTSEENLLQRRHYLFTQALEFCKDSGYTFLTNEKEIFNSNSIVEYICPKHGIHYTKIYALLLKHGCSECQYEKIRLSPKQVEQSFQKYNGQVLNPEDYVNIKAKNLKVVCPDCGDVFITSYNSFMTSKGQRCAKCAKSESQGEYAVRTILEKYKIKYIQEYTFIDCKDKNVLPFDFYLPEYNQIIEFDGLQHFIPSTFSNKIPPLENYALINKHDNIKNAYCAEKNIKLLRIPYYQISNVENILIKELKLT